jgi:5-methylcytosine-specific restriction endonuclease McrA
MRRGSRRKRRREWLVFARDGFRCVYCGASPVEGDLDREGRPVKLEIEHIVPRSAGGDDTVGNLVTSCRTCNRSKFDGELAPEDVARLRAVASARNRARGIRDDQVVDVGRV